MDYKIDIHRKNRKSRRREEEEEGIRKTQRMIMNGLKMEGKKRKSRARRREEEEGIRSRTGEEGW